MSTGPAGNRAIDDAAPAPSATTARRVAVICNQRGLHARAAARFVKVAHQFTSDIGVRKNGTIVSGRSIMGLMMLAAGAGVELEITATGPDAEDAVATLARLIECKFDED